MTKTIHLKTGTRSELVYIAHTLVKGLPTKLLMDAKKPVLISVRGDFHSGKSIFPDEAFTTLAIKNAVLDGFPNAAYHWSGTHRTGIRRHNITLSFINLDFNRANNGNIFSLPLDNEAGDLKYLDKDITIADAFIRARNAGGIVYVHNSSAVAQHSAWIDIVLRRGTGNVTHDIFPEWARTISITVSDPSLLDSSCFQRALRRMENIYGEDQTHTLEI